jgi:hypothetical protein
MANPGIGKQGRLTFIRRYPVRMVMPVDYQRAWCINANIML